MLVNAGVIAVETNKGSSAVGIAFENDSGVRRDGEEEAELDK